MSPEQLEGKNVDERSDIFALGDVLYEMATGQTAFSGKSKASLISAILKDDPLRVSQVQPMSPVVLDHVVKKCLAKDPEERSQNAYDVASELKWIAESSSTDIPSPSARKRLKMSQKLWMGISGALVLAFIIVSFVYINRPSVPESQVVRFTIPAPKNSAFQGGIAMSPDGKKLAFVATDESGITSLWIRQLDSTQAQRLPETDDASLPFWSPDSRLVGYFSRGKMRKINPAAGTPQIICDASDGRGGSWGTTGIIVFSPNANDGLYRVSAEGGKAETLLEQTGGSRRWPEILPDGKHFLYVHTTGTADAVGIYVGSFDWKESKKLLSIVSRVAYVKPGYLLYIDQGSLMCRRFDAEKLAFSGDPVPIAPQPWLDYYVFGSSGFSQSDENVLAYREGGNQQGQFTWYDRSGKKLSTIGPPNGGGEPAFSPDEKQVLFYQFQNVVGLDDEWLLDLTTGKLSRFTFDPSDDNTSAWSPDGSRIVWASVRSGEYELYEKTSSGAGVDEPLLINHVTKYPDSFSPDGKFLIYDQIEQKSSDIWILPMTGERKPFPYLQTPANEAHARWSPDGKWIAYTSDESGKSEIYVQGFPAAKTGKWQISNAGGDQVQWRRDGKELFYVAPDGSIMSVEVRSSESDFSAGTPTPLFRSPSLHIGITSSRNDYLVTGDGQRLLINTPLEDTTKFPITVVLNWKDLLKQ